MQLLLRGKFGHDTAWYDIQILEAFEDAGDRAWIGFGEDSKSQYR